MDLIQSLRLRLEKVESEIRRMGEMRSTEELMNRELFEKAYSGKVEEAEEIRRKIRGFEQQRTI